MNLDDPRRCSRRARASAALALWVIASPACGARTTIQEDLGAGGGQGGGDISASSSASSGGGVAICGDGVTQAGEDCDDGNNVANDGCVACVAASCGDAILHVGVEACDDGNTNENDACLSSCTKAACGDGFVWTGVEACDDGNKDNNDGCTNACVPSPKPPKP